MTHSEPQLLYKHGGGPVLQCQHQTAGSGPPMWPFSFSRPSDPGIATAPNTAFNWKAFLQRSGERWRCWEDFDWSASWQVAQLPASVTWFWKEAVRRSHCAVSLRTGLMGCRTSGRSSLVSLPWRRCHGTGLSQAVLLPAASLQVAFVPEGCQPHVSILCPFITNDHRKEMKEWRSDKETKF